MNIEPSPQVSHSKTRKLAPIWLGYVSPFMLGLAIAATIIADVHPGPDPWAPWVFWIGIIGGVLSAPFAWGLIRRRRD